MSPRPKRRVSAAIGAIERRGRYLIGRRRASGHLGGLWEFPGGKRKRGETWAACLKREIREELGVRIEVLDHLDSIRFRYSDRLIRLEVFRCIIVEGRPQPLGCDQLRWVWPSQLSRYEFPSANRRLIKRLALGENSGRDLYT